MIRDGFGGRFWEDFKAGETIRHRLGRTITQFDNLLFTTMGMNTASLHFDAEYARRTEWGKPIVGASAIISVVCGVSYPSDEECSAHEWHGVSILHCFLAVLRRQKRNGLRLRQQHHSTDIIHGICRLVQPISKSLFSRREGTRFRMAGRSG